KKKFWRLIYHGLKIFKKSANRKRFQSRQDFGTFSIYLVIGRLQSINSKCTLKKKNQIKYARQKCPVERQHFSINLNHQQKEIK
ncbi:hypothetical protein K6V42_12135, partial [Streptococcus suis]|uniref:hypothetical protein n=1 Tax=Streptococcus suis TaxID=1307 RepID=UPI001C979F0D